MSQLLVSLCTVLLSFHENERTVHILMEVVFFTRYFQRTKDDGIYINFVIIHVYIILWNTSLLFNFMKYLI